MQGLGARMGGEDGKGKIFLIFANFWNPEGGKSRDCLQSILYVVMLFSKARFCRSNTCKKSAASRACCTKQLWTKEKTEKVSV